MDFEGGRDEMFPPTHRDGIPWNKAPIPRWLHRCTPWTTATFRSLHTIDRCACGGMRVASIHGNGRWQERNSRK